MSGKGSPYRNIVLISQIGINMLVPVFICVAAGVWLDNRFHTWFTLPLLILGIAAGARNAYALAMDTIRMDEKRRKKNRRSRFKKFCERRRMRKIIDRIKELNEVLPEVFLVDLLYLLAGELVIWFLVPNKQMCAVGFFMGVVYSIFSSVHMSFRIRKIVYGHANESKTLLIGYFIRLAVMLVLFTVLYLFHIGDLLCALIGMFSMKVSAYLQPFTNKILSKKGR